MLGKSEPGVLTPVFHSSSVALRLRTGSAACPHFERRKTTHENNLLGYLADIDRRGQLNSRYSYGDGHGRARLLPGDEGGCRIVWRGWSDLWLGTSQEKQEALKL